MKETTLCYTCENFMYVEYLGNEYDFYSCIKNPNLFESIRNVKHMDDRKNIFDHNNIPLISTCTHFKNI